MELQKKVEEWTKKVLEKQNYKVTEIKFPDHENAGGAAGEIIFVDVKTKSNDEEKTLELLLKKSKDSVKVQGDMCMDRAYVNEINVYSKFVPYFNNFARKNHSEIFENIPTCYGTLIEENQYLVFLENLKVKGFKTHAITTPQTIDHAKLVIEAYAKWSALNLAVKDQEPEVFEQFGKCNRGFIGTKVFIMFVSAFEKELDSVLKLYEDKDEPEVVKKLKYLRENAGKLFEECFLNRGEKYTILRHGDCWNNNFLFHYDEKTNIPDKTFIIDWQLGVLGSPLADITQYIYYCCTIKELEKIDELLELFYKTFSEKISELGSEPEKCLPKGDFLKSFNRYAPVALVGMPMAVRLGCTTRYEKNFNMEKAEGDGDFSSFLSGKIDDPEEYFNRMNDVLKYSIKRGFL